MSRRYHQNRSSDASCGSNADVKVSKALSWILRHGCQQVGLEMDKAGFVSVDQLLLLPQMKGTVLADIQRITTNNSKQRFTIKIESDGRSMIRANQGHSIAVQNLDLTPITSIADCPRAIHGTQCNLWPAISSQGLSRMTRQHIHMAVARPGHKEVISGMRTNCDLLIYIDVQSALQDGLQLFKSSNNVILSPGNDQGFILPKYFQRVIRIDKNTHEETQIL